MTAVVCTWLAVGSGLAVPDEPASEYPRMKLFGHVFAEYAYETEQVAGQASEENTNAFEITRMYLGAKGDLSEEFKGNIILESRRDTNEALSGREEEVVLKSAHLAYTGIEGVEFLFGQAPLPWVAFTEDFWQHRMQGTMFSDREGYETTTDLGVSARGGLPNGYGTYHVGLFDGEGWAAPEQNEYKSAMGRLSVTPLPEAGEWVRGIGLHAFVDQGHYDAGNEPRVRRVAGASWKYKEYVTVLAEALRTRDERSRVVARHPSLNAVSDLDVAEGEGKAILAVVNGSLIRESWKRWSAIGRWDHLDPSSDGVSGDEHDRYISGVSCQWNRNVRFLVNHEFVHYAPDAGTPTVPREESNRAAFVAEFKF